MVTVSFRTFLLGFYTLNFPLACFGQKYFLDGASAVKRGLPQSISIFHLKNARRFEKNPNLKGRCKKAPRGTKFLPKPFYGHLPETPSRDFLQKAGSSVVRLTGTEPEGI